MHQIWTSETKSHDLMQLFPPSKTCKVVFDTSDVYFRIEKSTFDATFPIFRFEKQSSGLSKNSFSEEKHIPDTETPCNNHCRAPSLMNKSMV
jgi:hypothetical protein